MGKKNKISLLKIRNYLKENERDLYMVNCQYVTDVNRNAAVCIYIRKGSHILFREVFFCCYNTIPRNLNIIYTRKYTIAENKSDHTIG
jgi:hypothetical protein